MKILVAKHLDSKLLGHELGPAVLYHPDLAEQSEDEVRSALIDSHSTAAIVARPLSAATLTAWQEAVHQPVQLVQVHRGQCWPQLDLPKVSVAQVQEDATTIPTDLEALGLAERGLISHQTADRLAACGISSQGASTSIAGARVTLVGAGIVNLMTAYNLVEQGAAVDILDAGPDPRTQPDWQRLGATHGGGDARMFCFTEADNYNEKGNVVYADMITVLEKTIRDGGWLVTPPTTLSEGERSWIQHHCHLPRWMAEIFTQDIHRFNMASEPLWEQLRQQAAHLFDDVNYIPGVLRIYSQPEKFEAARVLHGRLGSLRRALDVDALVQHHPLFREAAASGAIAGALEIKGFTLSIHRFVKQLLNHLEARGVLLRWNLQATGLERTGDGYVSGIQTPTGIVRSEHYVLSPGAYGESLLQGTRVAGKIQGILGLWLYLPHLQPQLRHSVKIHREGHVGEDSNVTIGIRNGQPTLILGSGYGFIGTQPLNMESPEITCLFEALEVTAQRYFPQAYQQALQAGTLYGDRKACVRPFTSTGLGLFEVERTASGGRMVIATGHNTGGFTQAPAVADATTATLLGRTHPMQVLYAPNRGTLTQDTQASTVALASKALD